MEWFKILDAEEVMKSAPGLNKLIQVKAGGKKICLALTKDGYFAVQNTCPHAGGDLSQGWCEGSVLVCPLHRYEYNLKTGRGWADQGDAIRTYPLENRADGLYIGIKAGWSLFK